MSRSIDELGFCATTSASVSLTSVTLLPVCRNLRRNLTKTLSGQTEFSFRSDLLSSFSLRPK